jgi:hypothetical protein
LLTFWDTQIYLKGTAYKNLRIPGLFRLVTSAQRGEFYSVLRRKQPSKSEIRKSKMTTHAKLQTVCSQKTGLVGQEIQPPSNTKRHMTISTLPLRNTIRMASARSISNGAFASLWTTHASHHHRTLATTATTIAATTSPAASSSANVSWPVLHRLGLHRNNNQNNYYKRLLQFGGLGLTLAAAQYSLGDAHDFFEYRFTTNKKSEDLADFYGTEGML